MKPGTTEAIRAGCLCPVMDNFCGTCGRRYWVRASDQSQTKVRRFVQEMDELVNVLLTGGTWGRPFVVTGPVLKLAFPGTAAQEASDD